MQGGVNKLIYVTLKMRIMLHDISIESSKKHTIRKVGMWSVFGGHDTVDKEICQVVVFFSNYTLQHVSDACREMITVATGTKRILTNEFFPTLHVGQYLFKKNLVGIDLDIP